MSTWSQIVETVTNSAHESVHPKKLSAMSEHGGVLTISQAEGSRWTELTFVQGTQLTVKQSFGLTTEQITHYTIDGGYIVPTEPKKYTVEDFVRDVLLHPLLAEVPDKPADTRRNVA